MDLTISETTALGPSSIGVAPAIRSKTDPSLLMAAAKIRSTEVDPDRISIHARHDNKIDRSR